MAVENLGLYPLSTFDGEAIPYEIIRPIGLIRQDFTDVVSAAVTIPAATELIAFFSTNHCIVRFNGNAEVPANGVHVTNQIVIPAYTYMNVDHNGAATLTVIGLQDPGGMLFVTTVKRWHDMKKSVQFTRP